MTTVTWTTSAGTLATINEGEAYTKQLEANSDDSTTISYTKLAGTLPSGVTLSSTGLITGTPAEVSTDTTYDFVVRAKAGTAIADRTYALIVQGADAPVWSTGAGALYFQVTDDLNRADYTGTKTDVSTITADSSATPLQTTISEYYVMSKQLSATDTDDSTVLKYYKASGDLPPGITLSTSGLLSGIVGQIVPTTSSTASYTPTTKTYSFTVRATDSTLNSDRAFTITVSDVRTQIDPFFITGSDLGSYQHNTYNIIKIDVSDPNPMDTVPLTYSITSGALPSGLTLDTTNGEIYGTIGTQSALSTDYTFTVKAQRLVETADDTGVHSDTTSVTADSDGTRAVSRVFTMTVLGDVDKTITWTTGTNLGTINANYPVTKQVMATTTIKNATLRYQMKSGTLPAGVSLHPQGYLYGTVDVAKIYDGSTTLYDYSITVSAKDSQGLLSVDRTFTFKVSFPVAGEYDNAVLQAQSSYTDRNTWETLVTNRDIFSESVLYRSFDANFGIQRKPEMLLCAGVRNELSTEYQLAVARNFYNKRLKFGTFGYAEAKDDDGVHIYDAVYINVYDDIAGVSTSVSLEQNVTNTARVSDNQRKASITAMTVDGMTPIYPNSIENMRTRLFAALTVNEPKFLPLWMKTVQSANSQSLGYVTACVLAYVRPGQGKIVITRLNTLNYDLKTVDFDVEQVLFKINKGTIFDTDTTTFNQKSVMTLDATLDPVTQIDGGGTTFGNDDITFDRGPGGDKYIRFPQREIIING
jgi:hypothetical protein